jgi:hypothetical protein
MLPARQRRLFAFKSAATKQLTLGDASLHDALMGSTTESWQQLIGSD